MSVFKTAEKPMWIDGRAKASVRLTAGYSPAVSAGHNGSLALRPIRSLVSDVSLIWLLWPSFINSYVPGETAGSEASIKNHRVVCKTSVGMKGISTKLCRAGLISFILLSLVSVTSAMSLDLTEQRNKVSPIKVNPRWNLWASGKRHHDTFLQFKKKNNPLC